MAEIKIMDFDELSYKKEVKEYTVNTRLNLREEPSMEAGVVRIMEKGEKVKAVIDGEWAVLEDGYCVAKFLD